MTTCADVERLVSSYIDGDIDEHRARAVRGHARECARCARLLADEGTLAAWLGEQELAADPPDTLWRGIQERLATEEQGDARRSRLALWWSNARAHALPAAAVAAALALGWTWFVRSSPDATDERSPAPAVPTARSLASAAPTPVAQTFTDRRREQIADADQHYRDVVAELRADVGGAAGEGELAERLARLDAALARARSEAVGDDPAARDEIHRLYREQIAVLQDAALDGDWM